MISLNRDAVLDLLDQAVAERGEDYVYPKYDLPGERCVYVHDNQPSCIVGVVLHKAGIPLDELHELGDLHPDHEGGTTAVTLCGLLEAEHGVVITTAARSVLNRAQSFQDGGRPWGEAVSKARHGHDY